MTTAATGSPESSSNGLFIVFEGGDGSGKSTQSGELCRWLESRGHPVTATHEPGGGQLGQSIRQLLLHSESMPPRVEALLFAADRADHVASVVAPALRAGRIVVSDRYLDSSIAYQGAGRNLGAQQIADLSAWATEGLVADLTIVMDVPDELSRQRRRHSPDRMEAEAEEFHARVRAQFLAAASASPGRYLVVDASRPKPEVSTQIRRRAERLLIDRGFGQDLPLEPWGTP